MKKNYLEPRPFFIIVGDSRVGKTSFGRWLSILSLGKYRFMDTSELYKECEDIPKAVREEVKELTKKRLIGTPSQIALNRQNLRTFYQTFGHFVRQKAVKNCSMYIGARTIEETKDLVFRCLPEDRLPVVVEVLSAYKEPSPETAKFLNAVEELVRENRGAVRGFVFFNYIEDSAVHSWLYFIWNVWKFKGVMEAFDPNIYRDEENL